MVFVPAQKLSGIVWTPIRYASLHFRDWRGAAQPRSVTEIAPKSPFLCVKRSPIQYEFRAGAKAIQQCKHSLKLTKKWILSRFSVKSRSQHQFWGSPKKREFDRAPKPTPQNFGKKRERDKLYWNINTNEMSILRKKTHRTLDVFYLHMDGLFSIKIKVSYNAEIFFMRYRLIHDWLLILTPKVLFETL